MTAHETLGIAADASSEQIRTAYLQKVKEFPPERSPLEFERVRDAYDLLRDPRRRFLAHLLSDDFARPLADQISAGKSDRAFAGPRAWREAVKSK